MRCACVLLAVLLTACSQSSGEQRAENPANALAADPVRLKALRAQCRQASDTAHCGILSGLTQPGAAPAPVPAAARHVHGVHGRGL